MITGAKTQTEIGLSQNAKGVPFRCGTCEYFERGVCHNPNPKLAGKPVDDDWCCNLYDHKGMKVIV
jgi:hypothetical protein